MSEEQRVDRDALMESLTDAYADFSLVQGQLSGFMTSTVPMTCPHCSGEVPISVEAMMETLQSIIERYNTALETFRKALGAAAPAFAQKTVTYNGFQMSKSVSTYYDVAPIRESYPEVLSLPGVVDGVNHDVLDRLVADGTVPADVQALARKTVPGSVRISGAKAISFSLDTLLPTRRR